MTAQRSERAIGGGERLLLLWAGMVAVLLLAPPALVPGLGAASVSGLDQVGHFVLFLVLALLAVGPARARTRHPLLLAAAASILYGAALEVLQGVSGWRSAELSDLLADSAGSWAGVLVPALRWRA